MMKVYLYKNCDSCRKALKWLKERQVEVEVIPIREQPPAVEELRAAADQLGLRKLFNTSGMDYRALDLKSKLPTMSEDDQLKLLEANGNLVKRPFVIDTDCGTVLVVLVGFRVDEWEQKLG